MNLDYDKSFYKDIKKLKDDKLAIKLKTALLEFKEDADLSEFSKIKKMKGYNHYYRLQISDYRLGLSYKDGVLKVIRFMHRKEIYRYFP